jgi:hypothetical protein
MQKLKLALPQQQEAAKRKRKEKDPTACVWNDDWKYIPASDTDLAKRFRRIRREQALEQAKAMRRIK